MRTKRGAIAVAVVLLMWFTLACGDTREGRPTIADAGSRWRDFIAYIGLLPPGQLAEPWIIDPIDGSDAGDTAKVTGLAMSAVRAGSPDESGTVRVYVLPGTLSIPDDAYLVGTAPIDGKGNWELEDEVPLWAGRNTIAAVAHYGDRKSSPGSVVVRSDSTTQPPAGTAVVPVVAPKARKVRVAVIAGRPKGAPEFKSGLKERLHLRLRELREFYEADSYGALEIVDAKVDAGPKAKGYALPEGEEWYGQEADDDARWAQFVKDTIAASGVSAAEYDVIVCVQPGLPEQDDGEGPSTACWSNWPEKPGPTAVMILSDHTDRLGGWAHEFGHALGAVLKVHGPNAMPDLYERDDKEYWPLGYPGYTNLDEGDWAPFVLMSAASWNGPADGIKIRVADQTRPPQNLALCKQYLGWLTWGEHTTLPWVFETPTIETADYMAPVPTYRVDAETSYVFEARSSTWWSEEVPSDFDGSRLFIYRTRFLTEKHAARSSDVSTAWPDYVNGVALLAESDSDSFYFDPESILICRLESLKRGPNRITARVSVGAASIKALQDLIGNDPYSGAIMRPGGGLLPQPGAASPTSPASSSPATGTTVTVPDLDLHAYLPDGRHVGMDYETGQYENPIPRAVVSGDLVGDSEWILLPPDAAEGARYEVSSRDSEEYVKAAEAAGIDASSVKTGIEYTVTPTTAGGARGIDKGAASEGTLAPGKRLDFVVAASDEASPTLGGVVQAGTGDAPPDPALALYLPLGIAAGCALLIVVTWLLTALIGRRKKAKL